jgi:hypothetical protein
LFFRTKEGFFNQAPWLLFDGRFTEYFGFYGFDDITEMSYNLFRPEAICFTDGVIVNPLLCYSDSLNGQYFSLTGSECLVDIKETPNANFTLYPNPITNGTLTIQSGATIKRIELIDMLGQNVLSTAPVGSTVTISNVAQGLYVAKVVFANGKTGYKWVVVE